MRLGSMDECRGRVACARGALAPDFGSLCAASCTKRCIVLTMVEVERSGTVLASVREIGQDLKE
jgi:hypothetical protein